MKLLTLENAVTLVAVVVGLGAFYALGAYTDVGNGIRYVTMIGISVVLPMIVTTLYSS